MVSSLRGALDKIVDRPVGAVRNRLSLVVPRSAARRWFKVWDTHRGWKVPRDAAGSTFWPEKLWFLPFLLPEICVMKPHREHVLRANRASYDAMAAAGNPLCRPARPEELSDPLKTVDAAGWLGDSISGWDVLCLAAGGGRQSLLYAAAGARVTVVDLSPGMLELDRQVATQYGHDFRLLETSMDDLSGLDAGEFDLVIHPVSTCYLPGVAGVFGEVARVLRPGGLYVSQHKTPTSLQATTDRTEGGHYEIRDRYYRDEPISAPEKKNSTTRRLRESGAVEFLHRWEELIGGMCRAGFVIEDLVEPMHADGTVMAGTFADRAGYIAPYVRIKARRVPGQAPETRSRTLWLP